MLEMSAMMVSRDPRPVNGSGMPLVLCFSFLNSSSQVPMLPLAPRWVNGKREGHGMSACLDFADVFGSFNLFCEDLMLTTFSIDQLTVASWDLIEGLHM